MKSIAPASHRLTISVVTGLIVGVAASLTIKSFAALLVGWDVGALLFITWIWLTTRNMDPKATADMAVAEDPSIPVSDTILLVASIVSLVAVGLVMAGSSSATGAAKFLYVGLALVSVVVSWLSVHTIYMLGYARMFYGGKEGGVDFSTKPRYTDFAYLAFTIGMTYQVSDTQITDHKIRATALHQAFLSYLFGAVILAATINLVAGLVK